MEEDLEARVERLEKMWENTKKGKPFWIPYPSKKPSKKPASQKPSENKV